MAVILKMHKCLMLKNLFFCSFFSVLIRFCNYDQKSNKENRDFSIFQVSFSFADKKMVLEKLGVAKGWIFSNIFINVMHEFQSRLSCGNFENWSWSKATELFKRIQMYWQLHHCGWFVVDLDFTQNKVGIFWRWN